MAAALPEIDVAIIGGGLAGLACAVALIDSGLSVALFEADSALGGRARSWPDPHTGDVVDIGPHIFLSEYHNMLSLLALLGTQDRIVWQTERLIRLREPQRCTDMHLHALPPPFHLAPSFAKVKSLSLRDKLSNHRMLWLAMQTDEQQVHSLDSLSALELLERNGVTPRFIHWFWASACMAVLNVPLEHCSAGALLRVFSQLIGLQEYRIGFATHGLSELYAPQAVQRIEASGGRIDLRTPIAGIDCASGRARGIQLGDGTRIRARFCVMAVPPQSLRELLPEALGSDRSFIDIDAFEPSPYISSYVWFDRKLSDEKFWARIWDPRDLNSDFYDLSNIRAGWRERPSVIACNAIYSHRAAEWSDGEIATRTLHEIFDALPHATEANVRHVSIHRIPMAIPCPSPGTETKRPAQLTPIDGLLLAGDWTRTALPASMESAVYSGLAAAEHIWRAIGRPRQLTQAKRSPEGFAGWVQRHASN